MSNLKTLKPFKKGVSGNPKGKAVGTLSMTTKIREFLMEYGKDGETNADKLKRSMVLRAITKSDVLAKEILDRIDGKVPLPVEGKIEGNLIIQLSEVVAKKYDIKNEEQKEL